MIDYAPHSKRNISWDEAWLYCLTLSYGGHKDWRMPTRDEYQDIDDIPGGTFDYHDNINNDIAADRSSVTPVRDI